MGSKSEVGDILLAATWADSHHFDSIDGTRGAKFKFDCTTELLCKPRLTNFISFLMDLIEGRVRSCQA